MFSSRVGKLPVVPVNKAWALLKGQDGKTLHEFLVNPEELQQDITAECSELAIAGTAQPIQKYKHSTGIVRIPSALLLSEGFDRDIDKALDELKALTRPTASGSLTPVDLVWGKKTIKYCYVTAISIKERRWRGGVCTGAELSIDLTPTNPTPKIGTAPIDGEIMTDREKAGLAAKITAYYQREKIAAAADGIRQESKISVRDDGVYLENPKESPKRLGDLEPYRKLVAGEKPKDRN